MKVVYYIPRPEGLGAARWIYKAWKHAFEDLGHRFVELTVVDDLRATVQLERPDILFIANLVDLVALRQTLQQIRKTDTKIFMVISWPLSKPQLHVIRNYDLADIYFGEREDAEFPQTFRDLTGRRYELIPYAADQRMDIPTRPVPRYQYDIVYLGAYLPKKKRAFDEVLRPLIRKYRVGVFGPNWTLADNLLRLCQRLAREVRWTSATEFFTQRRVAIPEGRENALYSSAKISLNFHEREPDGSQPHYVLNQRTFKIPACGGFEICDYVPALRKYFDDDEVVMTEDNADCLAKVEYYLKHAEERKRIQEKGTAKALKCHTYYRRVEQVLSFAASIGPR